MTTSPAGFRWTAVVGCRRPGWRWCRCCSMRRTSPIGRPLGRWRAGSTGVRAGMQLTEPGFDHSVLSEFRDRLAEGDRADRLLAVMVDRLAEAGLVRARGRQRTDSTHVLAAVRRLSRVELVAETMRAALESLAKLEEVWLAGVMAPQWAGRY